MYRPANVLPPDAPGLRALTSLVAGIAVIGELYFGREVLIPVTLAVLLSFLVEPFVEFLRRFKLGKISSVIVAVLVALGFVLAVGALIGAQVAQLADSLLQYQVAFERKGVRIQELTIARADAVLGNAASALKRVTPTHMLPPAKGGNATAEANDTPMPVVVHEPSPSPVQLAQRLAPSRPTAQWPSVVKALRSRPGPQPKSRIVRGGSTSIWCSSAAMFCVTSWSYVPSRKSSACAS